MSQSEHIKLGYLRDPENHEMYFPYTHYLGVVGLDSHILHLIGGTVPTKLSDLTNDLTSTGKVTLNGSSVDVLRPYGNTTDQVFFAPAAAGSQYNLLMSNGTSGSPNAAPTWTNLTLSTAGLLKFTPNSGWSLDTSTYLTSFAHKITVNSGNNTSGTAISGTSATSSENPSVDLGNSGVTEGTYSTNTTTSLSAGGTFKVPTIRVNKKGIVIDAKDTVLTLPSAGIVAAKGWAELPSGHTSQTISSSGAGLSGDTINIVGGTRVTLKQVLDSNNNIVGYEINSDVPTVSDIFGAAAETGKGYLERYMDGATPKWRLSTPITTVYNFTVKNSGDTVNEFDPDSAASYVDISMVHSNGNETTQSTVAGAGLKMTNGTNTFYQKISTSALINDAVDTLVLNGNFS